MLRPHSQICEQFRLEFSWCFRNDHMTALWSTIRVFIAIRRHCRWRNFRLRHFEARRSGVGIGTNRWCQPQHDVYQDFMADAFFSQEKLVHHLMNIESGPAEQCFIWEYSNSQRLQRGVSDLQVLLDSRINGIASISQKSKCRRNLERRADYPATWTSQTSVCST